MRCVIILALLIIQCVVVSSQKIEWKNVFEGDFPNVYNDAGIVSDSLGNIYVPSHNIDEKIYLTKYDVLGNELWTTSWTNTINVEVRAIKLGKRGSVYLGGIEEDESGTFNMAIIKVYPNGNIAWVQTYDEGILFDFSHEELFNLDLDQDDNVYAVGIAGSFEFLTVKYDSTGIFQWVDEYLPAGASSGELSHVYVNSSNEIYVLGTITINFIGKTRLIKYDGQGQITWDIEPPTSVSLVKNVNALLVDNSGDIYVCGHRSIAGDIDVVLQKINTNGGLIWGRIFDPQSNGGTDYMKQLRLKNQISPIVLAEKIGGNGFEYAMVEYDSNGTEIWSRVSDEVDHLIVNDFQVNCDGEFIVIGRLGNDGYLERLDANGLSLKKIVYTDTMYNQTPFEYLEIDSFNNNVIVGSMTPINSGSNKDVVTAKYIKTSGSCLDTILIKDRILEMDTVLSARSLVILDNVELHGNVNVLLKSANLHIVSNCTMDFNSTLHIVDEDECLTSK